MPNTVAVGVAYEDPQLDNAIIGKSATLSGKVGFYGKTPIVQRSSSVQATSNLASSADFGATQLATMVEIMNTLAAVGLWKGSA
jgi:hypothetical protein